MNDTDRIIGRLEEFKDHTLKRLDGLDEKIDDLQRFKWRLAGGAAVIGIIISLVMQFAAKAVNFPLERRTANSRSDQTN